MSNRPNPYFHRSPTRTIHHIFSNPSPTQSLPLTDRASTPSRLPPPSPHQYPIISQRPPSQRSNRSSISLSSNASSQSNTQSYSIISEIERSVNKRRERERQNMEGERVKEILIRANKRIRELEDKEIEGVIIKNENVNLRSEVSSLRAEINDMREVREMWEREVREKGQKGDERRDAQIIKRLEMEIGRHQQENLRLRQEMSESNLVLNELRVEIERLKGVIKEERENYREVSLRCQRVQEICKGMEMKGEPIRDLQETYSFMNIENMDNRWDTKPGGNKPNENREIRINKSPYTNMYQ